MHARSFRGILIKQYKNQDTAKQIKVHPKAIEELHSRAVTCSFCTACWLIPSFFFQKFKHSVVIF